jgi:hypothetical protein
MYMHVFLSKMLTYTDIYRHTFRFPITVTVSASINRKYLHILQQSREYTAPRKAYTYITYTTEYVLYTALQHMIRAPSYMYVYMSHIRSYKSVEILTYMLNYTYIYCYAGSLMQAPAVLGNSGGRLHYSAPLAGGAATQGAPHPTARTVW